MASSSETMIVGDGLWLVHDGVLYQLDHPDEVPEMGDRDRHVALALLNLALERITGGKMTKAVAS